MLRLYVDTLGIRLQVSDWFFIVCVNIIVPVEGNKRNANPMFWSHQLGSKLFQQEENQLNLQPDSSYTIFSLNFPGRSCSLLLFLSIMYANSSKMLTAQQYIAYICDAQLGSCINFVLAVHLKFSTMPKTSFHCSLPSHLSISYLSLTPIHYWRRTTYICDHQSKLETKKCCVQL